jgi:hypothetical protein
MNYAALRARSDTSILRRDVPKALSSEDLSPASLPFLPLSRDLY